MHKDIALTALLQAQTKPIIAYKKPKAHALGFFIGSTLFD
jgi:hypothetical protein